MTEVIHPAGRPPLEEVDFERAPFLVIWETTQACDLACRHCRADAQPERDGGELSTDEAKRVMEDVRRFGRPLFVLTGGDPLKRPDVVELVEHGARIGLRMAMTPSGTPLMTPGIVRRLADAGLSRLKGKCGVCEYRDVCGGSRARAYALTGDYLEAEP